MHAPPRSKKIVKAKVQTPLLWPVCGAQRSPIDCERWDGGHAGQEAELTLGVAHLPHTLR